VDIRDLLIDGIQQMNEWLGDAIKDLSEEQLNHLPAGKAVSAGFNAWHIYRTEDNITNFVFQRKPPIWLDRGYATKLALPERDQGTGMSSEDARAIRISSGAVLREYGGAVAQDCLAFLKNVSADTLAEVQMIRPLGEMPKWKVFRQVIMTHGFMHLGEVNAIKGTMGLAFSI
jgi:uncharacterized damage-inducible protein DinB